MRPEITQYLVKITVELADILGIELHQETDVFKTQETADNETFK